MVRLILAGLLVACQALGQSAPAPQGETGNTPVFRAGAHAVEITFVATQKDGTTVPDLTPEDLRVFDEGKEQKIATFEKITPAEPGRFGSRVAGAKTNVRAKRLSVLVLDALNTEFSDQAYARRAATAVLEQLQPDDAVAIFALTGRLLLLHDFTSDPASLSKLVRNFSGDATAARESGPPGTSPYSAEFSYRDLLPPGGGIARQFRQRQRILDTLSAMKTIAGLLKPAPGRKSLIWISAGFPLTVAATGAARTDPLDTESFHDEVAGTMRVLSAANVSIYPVDARGLSVSPKAYVNIESMKEMAQETGGKAFYNSNGIAQEVRAALDDSKDAYILTFDPVNYKADKALHRLRLQTSRPGVRLRYRPAYFAD